MDALELMSAVRNMHSVDTDIKVEIKLVSTIHASMCGLGDEYEYGLLRTDLIITLVTKQIFQCLTNEERHQTHL